MICSKCNKDKPESEYSKVVSRGKIYLRKQCNNCKLSWHRKYNAENQESIKLSRNKHLQKTLKKVKPELKEKQCSCCNQVKKITRFRKDETRKDGYINRYYDCLTEKYKDRKPEWDKQHYEKNSDSIKTKTSQYRKNNKSKVRKWSAGRRARELQATPTWLTLGHKMLIGVIYKSAEAIQEATNEEHQVDHIIPLKSELVCGLHVPWNLQVLTAKENRQKSNKLEGV